MKRKFVTNLALLILLNILVKPFWIYGIEREVQNAVGAESFGIYFSLFSFSIILNILLDVGIINFNNKEIAQHNQLFNKYISNIVPLKFILSIFYGIICLSVGFFIGYDWYQFKILILLIFNQFLISFTLYLRSNLSGLHLFKTDSFISVLDKTLMAFICGVLLYIYVWGVPKEDEFFKIEWFVYSQTAAYIATTLIALITVLRKTKSIKLKYDNKFFIAILKQSFPYALLILLMGTYNRFDPIILERLLPNGKEQAGIYAQAFRNLDAVSMFGVLFAGLLLPMFAKMIKQKENIVELLQLSASLLIIPSIVLAISCYFYSNEIMRWMYDNHFNESAPIFGILMFGFISIATTYIFGTLLTANGNLKQLNIMAAIGVVLNITLNLMLVPKFEAYGSAMVSLSTQTFTALSQVYIAKRVFNLKINYKFLSLITVFTLGIIALGITTKEYINNWAIGFFTLIALSMILAFSIKLISLKALYNIIKYEK